MVAPPGATEHFSGYPVIDPATINPEMDWPGIENAQADWLDMRVHHPVANEAEFNLRFSGLPSTERRLVSVRSDKSLRYFDGTTWSTIFKGGSLTPRTSYDAAWRQASDGNEIGTGNGSETYWWNRGTGTNVHVSGFIVRGSTTAVGSGAYVWNLPVTPRSYRAVSGTGLVAFADGAEYPCILRGTGGLGVVLMLCHNRRRVGTSVASSDLPAWTAGGGDQITFDVTYEGIA